MPEPRIFQLSDFEPLVGSDFTLSLDGCDESVTALLVEAERSKNGAPPDSTREPFALLFRLPPKKQIAQANYKIHHPEFGSGLLFLVPINAKQDGYYMEAVFN